MAREMPRPASHALGLSLAIASVASLAAAQEHDSILQPASYASRSGEHVLEIEPSGPDGLGPSTYSMTTNGQPVWSAEQPFSLWRAAVSDRGAVAGYAYVEKDPPLGWPESLRLFVLSPNGEVLSEDVHVPDPPTGGHLPRSGCTSRLPRGPTLRP